MFEGVRNGWGLIKASLTIFSKFPIFLVPLLVVWSAYAPTVIYFKWHFNWNAYTTNEILLIIFLVLFGFALLLTISCSILLELILERETGKAFNLFTAIKDTLTKNIIQILATSFVWATVWFILTILEILFSKKKSSGNEDENAANVAKTLSGMDNASLLSPHSVL